MRLVFLDSLCFNTNAHDVSSFSRWSYHHSVIKCRHEEAFGCDAPAARRSSFSSLLLSSLALIDTNVYGPWIRALLGTATHFCREVLPTVLGHLSDPKVYAPYE